MIDVIVPCRNEEKYIYEFLKCIFGQTAINFIRHIFISDGQSNDNTREIISQFQQNFDSEHKIVLLDNVKRTTPHGLNQAILNCEAEYICRLDVHSSYPDDYIQKLLNVLQRSDFDCVGARWDIYPGADSKIARGIALSLNSVLAVGSVAYKDTANFRNLKVECVDAVPFGFFRRSVFEKIGVFNTALVKNQDNEFFDRMRAAGLKIGLLSDLKINYFARPTFWQLAKNYFAYGLYTPLVDRLNMKINKRRVAPVFALILFVFTFIININISLIMLVTYLSLIVIYAIYKKIPRQLLLSFLMAHIVIHGSFSLGYLRGIRNVVCKQS